MKTAMRTLVQHQGILAAFPVDRPLSAHKNPGHVGLRASALRALEVAIQTMPCLLDLKVDITVMVPEEWAEDVRKDMQSPSDFTYSMPIDNGYCMVISRMPLKHSFGYAGHLKRISQGTASFTLRVAKHAHRY